MEHAVLRSLWENSCAWPFHKPVDPQALDLPVRFADFYCFDPPESQIFWGFQDYFDVVKKPMDMGTIREKLQQHLYANVDECLRDFNLMFSNCRLYNKPGSDIVKFCAALEKAYHHRLAYMPQPVSSEFPSLELHILTNRFHHSCAFHLICPLG